MEDLKIPVVAGGGAQAGPQGFLLSGVGRKTGPQVDRITSAPEGGPLTLTEVKS